MDASGTIVIPKGGLGMGAINGRGEWVNKSELVAVYEDGKPADLVPSSFSAPIELEDRVTVEELLDHEIKAVYQLDSKDGCEEFQKQLSGSGIYTSHSITGKIMKATHSIDDSMLLEKWGGPKGLGEAIIKEDPDIDFEKIGMFVSGTRKVYLKPDGQVAYSVELNEVLKNPDGTEKTRRPLGQNEANVSS